MSQKNRGVSNIPAGINSTLIPQIDARQHYVPSKSNHNSQVSNQRTSAEFTRLPSHGNSANSIYRLPEAEAVYSQHVKSEDSNQHPTVTSGAAPLPHTKGIVVMLFHDRQLLYRYPPEDPFEISPVDGANGSAATHSNTSHATAGTSAVGSSASAIGSFINSMFVGATFSPPDEKNSVEVGDVPFRSKTPCTNDTMLARASVPSSEIIGNDSMQSGTSQTIAGVGADRLTGEKNNTNSNNIIGSDISSCEFNSDESCYSSMTSTYIGSSSSCIDESSSDNRSTNDNVLCGGFSSPETTPNCILGRNSDAVIIKSKKQHRSKTKRNSSNHLKRLSSKRKEKYKHRKPSYKHDINSSIMSSYNPSVTSSDTFSSFDNEERETEHNDTLFDVRGDFLEDLTDDYESISGKKRESVDSSSLNIIDKIDSVTASVRTDVIPDSPCCNERLLSEKSVASSPSNDEIPQKPTKIILNPANRRAMRGVVPKTNSSTFGTTADAPVEGSSSTDQGKNTSIKDDRAITQSPLNSSAAYVREEEYYLKSSPHSTKAPSMCEKNEQVSKVTTDVNQIGTAAFNLQANICPESAVPIRPSISIAKWLPTTSTACLGLPESCWSYIFQSDINGSELRSICNTPCATPSLKRSSLTFPNNNNNPTCIFPNWKKKEDHDEDDTEDIKDSTMTDDIVRGFENGAQSSRCLMVKICRAQMLVYPVGMLNFNLFEHFNSPASSNQTQLKRDFRNQLHVNQSVPCSPIYNSPLMDERINILQQHGGNEVLSILFSPDDSLSINDHGKSCSMSSVGVTKNSVLQHGGRHITSGGGTSVSTDSVSFDSDASPRGGHHSPSLALYNELNWLIEKEPMQYHPESSHKKKLDDMLAHLHSYNPHSSGSGRDGEDAKAPSLGPVNNLLQRSSLHVVVAIDDIVLNNLSEPQISYSHDSNPIVCKVHSIIQRFVAALEREERTGAYLTEEVAVLTGVLHNLREQHTVGGPNIRERNISASDPLSSKHHVDLSLGFAEDKTPLISSKGSAGTLSSSTMTSAGSSVSKNAINNPLNPSMEVIPRENEGLFSFLHRATDSSLCDALCSLAGVVSACITPTVDATRVTDSPVSRGTPTYKQGDITDKSVVHPYTNTDVIPKLHEGPIYNTIGDTELIVNCKLTFPPSASSFQRINGRAEGKCAVMNLIAYMRVLPCPNSFSASGLDPLSPRTRNVKQDKKSPLHVPSNSVCNNYGHDVLKKYSAIAKDCLGELDRLLRYFNSSRVLNTSVSKQSMKVGGNSVTRDNLFYQLPSHVRDEWMFIISGPDSCAAFLGDANERKSQDVSTDGQFVKKVGTPNWPFGPFVKAVIEETPLFSALNPIYNAAASCMAYRLEEERDIMMRNIRQPKPQIRTPYAQKRFANSKSYSHTELPNLYHISPAALTSSLISSPFEMMCHLLPIYTVCGQIYGLIPPIKGNKEDRTSQPVKSTELPCRSIGGLRRVLYHIIQQRFLEIENDEVVMSFSASHDFTAQYSDPKIGQRQSPCPFFTQETANSLSTVSSASSGVFSSGSNVDVVSHSKMQSWGDGTPPSNVMNNTKSFLLPRISKQHSIVPLEDTSVQQSVGEGMFHHSTSSPQLMAQRIGPNRLPNYSSLGSYDRSSVGSRSFILSFRENYQNHLTKSSNFGPLKDDQKENIAEFSIGIFIHLLRILGLLVLFEPAVILLGNGGVSEHLFNHHMSHNEVLNRNFLLVTPLQLLNCESSILPHTELQKYCSNSASVNCMTPSVAIGQETNSITNHRSNSFGDSTTTISFDSEGFTVVDNTSSKSNSKAVELKSVSSLQMKGGFIGRLINITNVHYYNILPVNEVYYNSDTRSATSLTCIFGEGCNVCRALLAAANDEGPNTTNQMLSLKFPFKHDKCLQDVEAAFEGVATASNEDEHYQLDPWYDSEVPYFDDVVSKETYMRSVQRPRVIGTWFMPPPLISIDDENNLSLCNLPLMNDIQRRHTRNKSQTSSVCTQISSGRAILAEGSLQFPMAFDPYVALFEPCNRQRHYLLGDSCNIKDRTDGYVGLNCNIREQNHRIQSSSDAFCQLLAFSLKGSKQHLKKEWNAVNDRIYNSFGVKSPTIPFIYSNIDTFLPFRKKGRNMQTFDHNVTQRSEGGKLKCHLEGTEEMEDRTALSQSSSVQIPHTAAIPNTTVSQCTVRHPVTDLLLFHPSNTFSPLGLSEESCSSISSNKTSLPLPYPALLVVITNIMIFLFWHRHVNATATINNLVAARIVTGTTSANLTNCQNNVSDPCNNTNNINNNSDNQNIPHSSSRTEFLSDMNFRTLMSPRDELQSRKDNTDIIPTTPTGSTSVEFISPVCPHSLPELAHHVSHHLSRVDKALEKMKIIVSFVNTIVREEVQCLFQRFITSESNGNILSYSWTCKTSSDADKVLAEEFKNNFQIKRALRHRRAIFMHKLTTAALDALSLLLRNIFASASSIFVSSPLSNIDGNIKDISPKSEDICSFQGSISQTLASAKSNITTHEEAIHSASRDVNISSFMFSQKTEDGAKISEKFQKVTLEVAATILGDLLEGQYCSRTYMSVGIEKWGSEGNRSDDCESPYPTLPLLLNREDIRRALVVGLCREFLGVDLCNLSTTNQFLENLHSVSAGDKLGQLQKNHSIGAHHKENNKVDVDVELNETTPITGLISVQEVLINTYRSETDMPADEAHCTDGRPSLTCNKHTPTFSQKEILQAGRQLLNGLARTQDNMPAFVGKELSENIQGANSTVILPSDSNRNTNDQCERKVFRSQEVSWDDQKLDMVVLLQIHNIFFKIEERRLKSPDEYLYLSSSHESGGSHEEKEEVPLDQRMRRSYMFPIEKLGFARAGDGRRTEIEMEGTVLPPIQYAMYVLGLPSDWLRHFSGCKVKCSMLRSERGRSTEDGSTKNDGESSIPKKIFAEDIISTPLTVAESGNSDESSFCNRERQPSFPLLYSSNAQLSMSNSGTSSEFRVSPPTDERKGTNSQRLGSLASSTHQGTVQSSQHRNSCRSENTFEGGRDLNRQLEVSIHHVLHLFPEVFQITYSQI